MIPFSPVLTEAWLKHKNATDESIHQRSFKLRSNKREVCTYILGLFCLSSVKLNDRWCCSLFHLQMRAYRYGTYSSILGSGTSLLYNRTVLPGLLFGISAGTIAGFVQNTKEKYDK